MKTTLPLIIGFLAVLQPLSAKGRSDHQPATGEKTLDEVMVETARTKTSALGYVFGK